MTFDALPGADTVIDIAADKVRSATLNGIDIDVSGYDESTGIALAGLDEHNVLVVDADCAYSNTGEGLHRFVDPVDNEVYLYSQFETADAKRMFACFDQPDLKATFDVTVTAPAHWQVVSNGATADVAERDGAKVHTFATTPRMSTYLVALIAGPYARWDDNYSDEHGDIALGLFCRASLAEYMDAERLFTQTKQGFGFYHQNFGVPYAFGKYDQLFVPEFNAGAMENAGAVTFLEDYVFRSKVTRASYERRAETVLHEMAHMWFGDLVTMRWWDDLWLNESFATFASVLCQSRATEYTEAWTTFANVEKSWAYRQDQLPSTHPIAADIPDLAAVEVNFDGITYAKGASVLKQLVAYVGLDHFLAGLRDYFRAHAFDNATFDDLLVALEKASGRDLSDWGGQWLKTTGLNTLRPDFDVDADGRFTRFAIRQSGAAPGAGETRVHRLAVGVYDDDGTGQAGPGAPRGARRRRRAHRSACTARRFTRQADPGQRRRPDVLLAAARRGVAGHRAVADRRHRRAAAAHAGVVGGLGDDPRRRAARPRLRVTGVRRGAGRDRGRGGAAAAAAGAERARLLCRAGVGVRARLADVRRPAAGTRSRARQPGSDHQLAYVNALCSSVLKLRHIEVLSALLDTDPADRGLAGLVVDTDLRWRIVTALASAGVVDADGPETPFIDAEVQRDPTAAGKRHGAAASAARPQTAVKERAWTDGDRGRHAAQHRGAGDHRRLRRAGAGGAAGTFHVALLRGHRRRVGAALQRGGADRGHRPVSGVGHHRGGHRGRRPLPGRRPAAGPAPVGDRREGRRRAGAEGPPLRRRLSRETACRETDSRETA